MSKQTCYSREKQLDENFLLKKQIKEVEEFINICKRKFEEEDDFIIVNFSIPKRKLATSLRNKTKSNTRVTCTLTNITR